MGMYREIEMALVCQRCGGEHRSPVQFKTGDDQGEVHTEGDVVPDLPAHGEWEGIVERFCGACHAMFCGERELAMASVLAAFVRDERLVLPLALAQIFALGDPA